MTLRALFTRQDCLEGDKLQIVLHDSELEEAGKGPTDPGPGTSVLCMS